MSDREKKTPTPLRPAGEATLPMSDLPPETSEKRQIHARRPLPLVPEHRRGEEPEDRNDGD